MPSESEIIRGCIEGDRRSQNLLFEKYYPLMTGIARRYYSNVDDIKNVVNAGFLKVLSRIETFKAEHKLGTWIGRIVINTIIDEHRKQERYKKRIQLVEYEPNEGKASYNLAEVKWEADELLSMLYELPDLHRTVFNMFVFDGFKHKEIAKNLDITEGASRWHLAMARKKLKLELERRLRDEEQTITMKQKA